MFTVLFSALVGAVLNRFSGWTNQTWIPGRHIYWAALAAFLITWALVDIGWAIAVGVSALTYRIPGWYGAIDMGTNDGTLKKDAETMFLCSLRIAPVFAWAVFQGVYIAPLLLLIAAAGATAVYALGNYAGKKLAKDPFRYIELGAGAVLGGIIGLLIAL